MINANALFSYNMYLNIICIDCLFSLFAQVDNLNTKTTTTCNLGRRFYSSEIINFLFFCILCSNDTISHLFFVKKQESLERLFLGSYDIVTLSFCF